ncbi:hypothetical protein ACOMHN_016118 [Nucella lapillus]
MVECFVANKSPSETVSDDLKERIVIHLGQHKSPRTALEVARGVGAASKRAINPVLYQLKRDLVVLVEGTRGSKPLWGLSDQACAMAEELFRDTSDDTSAPGAYSPEKKASGVLHSDKHLHRQLQRNNSRPYDSPAAHASQRRRNQSGSGQSPATAPPQGLIRHSDSGIVADSGGPVREGSVGEEMTVTSVSADGREVALSQDRDRDDRRPPQTGKTRDEFDQTERKVDPGCGVHVKEELLSPEPSGSNAGNPRRRNNNDDDEKSDVDDYEDEYSSGFDFEPRNLDERFRDMMGNLEFSHMTYMEEESYLGGDDDSTAAASASISPEDIVLLRLWLEPNQTASAHHLAQVLHKSEEEMAYVLGHCGDKVTTSDNLWRLTDRGSAWAREKYEASPSLVQHLGFSDYSSSAVSSACGEFGMSPPLKGPPLFPQELIATNPSFYLDSQPGSGPLRSSTTPSGSAFEGGGGGGLGRGRGGGSGEGGVATNQPTDSSSVKSESFQQIHPAEQQSAAASATAAAAVSSGPSLRVQRMSQFCSAPPSLPSLPPSLPTMPPSLSSINPSLHRFAQEGLTVVPATGARLMLDQAGGGGFGSLEGMSHSVSSVDVLERQMGNTGLASSMDGAPEMSMRDGGGGGGGGGSSGYLGDNNSSVSLFGDLHRSHSLPQLGSDPGALAGGEGPQSMLKITSESFAALNKNPISALMEYAQSRRLQAIIEVVSQKGPSHRPVFLMAARVGMRQFPGVTCSNKKDGRKEAADVALRTLIAEGQYSAAALTPSINVAPETMTHFDKIAALTHQTFNQLIASIPENLAGRKVIAGLVMKRSDDDVGGVISIGTGNRCITGDKLSLEGNTVNDSHAEIITRRGFMRFLYQQLEKYDPDQPHDLFEPSSSGRLRVKDGISFHLYISTAPCGDGALFSPRDVESNSAELSNVDQREHHPTFTSNVQGLLRTKMEGGEGTIPVDTRQVSMQTWDGVVRGERLRTMSCTDKICRWNVLGLQGALLSHFLDPIYLSSLTLGFLYDHGHLSRAVCCRLAREDPPLEDDLPAGFRLNHPWLGRVTACQPLRETQKTKALSINWTLGDQKAEVLDGTLGQCYTAVEKRLFSRLAKRSLYDSFKVVAQRLGRSDLLQAPSYHANKQGAEAFQRAKGAMVAKFQQLGCGWVKKPVEEEMFS